MPEQKLSPAEHRMMQDAFVYLRDHCCPPPNDGSDTSLAWWREATRDAGALVGAKWKNHKLIMGVVIALMDYIETKLEEEHTDDNADHSD